MDDRKDLVSVIIPTYNRAHLIKRSAQSVLGQTYKNLELIIVDDGSTDNTEDVVKSLDDERVVYIKQTNQGACAARNNGIDHARGEFIAFQDSDDVWHNDKLEKQINCLKETGADIVFCCLNRIENGKIVEIKGSYFKEGFMQPSTFPSNIGTQTLVAKYKVFEYEKFDESMPRLQDLELLLRVQKKQKLYCMKLALVDYYIQDKSISNDKIKLFEACEILLNKYQNYAPNEHLLIYIIRVAFASDDRRFQKVIFDFILKSNISRQAQLRILAYKFGIYKFYKTIRSLLSVKRCNKRG